MKALTNFGLTYKIPITISNICLATTIILYIATKYIQNEKYSLIIMLFATMYALIAFILFTFIILHYSIKYTAWSILTGIIGSIIAILGSTNFLVMAMFYKVGYPSLVLVISIGYFIGATIGILIKSIYNIKVHSYL